MARVKSRRVHEREVRRDFAEVIHIAGDEPLETCGECGNESVSDGALVRQAGSAAGSVIVPHLVGDIGVRSSPASRKINPSTREEFFLRRLTAEENRSEFDVAYRAQNQAVPLVVIQAKCRALREKGVASPDV